MNILAWQRTCRHHPPRNDVASTRPESLADVLFPDALILPMMIAARRFGVGEPLWPEALPNREAFNAALS